MKLVVFILALYVSWFMFVLGMLYADYIADRNRIKNSRFNGETLHSNKEEKSNGRS